MLGASDASIFARDWAAWKRNGCCGMPVMGEGVGESGVGDDEGGLDRRNEGAWRCGSDSAEAMASGDGGMRRQCAVAFGRI